MISWLEILRKGTVSTPGNQVKLWYFSQCYVVSKLYITKSSSAAGRTRRRLGNTSTCPYYAFRHMTKSSSAAGCTRRRLGNTSTCPYYASLHFDKNYLISEFYLEKITAFLPK